MDLLCYRRREKANVYPTLAEVMYSTYLPTLSAESADSLQKPSNECPYHVHRCHRRTRPEFFRCWRRAWFLGRCAEFLRKCAEFLWRCAEILRRSAEKCGVFVEKCGFSVEKCGNSSEVCGVLSGVCGVRFRVVCDWTMAW